MTRSPSQPKTVCDEVEAEARVAGHLAETLVGEEERVTV